MTFFSHLACCSIPNSFPNSTQNLEHKCLLKEGNWKLIHGFCHIHSMGIGFPRWLSGKESACLCRRHGFSPWVEKIPWSRKWQPTPVFLPQESHGQRSLVGYSPWGCKESYTTDHIGIHSGDILQRRFSVYRCLDEMNWGLHQIPRGQSPSLFCSYCVPNSTVPGSIQDYQ